MKKIIFMLLSILHAILFAQGVNFDWAGSAGSSNMDEGRCLEFDINGNIIMSGVFRGTVDFDLGPGTSNLTSVGQYSSFIAKYDPTGVLIWVKKLDHTNVNFSNQVKSMTVDQSNNIILTGSFEYGVDLDPGAGTLNVGSAGSVDVFVVKLTGNGDLVWGKRFGGSNYEAPNAIITDNSESIYIGGFFQGTGEFDPGPGVVNQIAQSWQDVYILKLDPSGNFRWVNVLTSSDGIYLNDIEISNGIEPVIVGSFRDTADFDPGAGVNQYISIGSGDMYYQRMDSSGTVLNTLTIGSTSNDLETQLVCLSNGEKIWTGTVYSTADINPGPDTVLTTGFFGSAFMIKLDNNDDLLESVELIGGNSNVYTSVDVDYDSLDGIYWYGKYVGSTADLDPTSSVYTLPSLGFQANQFIVKMDTSLNFEWAKRLLGANNPAEPARIAVHSTLDVYTTGHFYGTQDVDPGPNNYSLTSIGDKDIYLIKLKPCTYSYSTLNVTTCYSYTNPSSTNTYYTSGTYTDYLMNAAGCDSLITINLTINNDTWSSTVVYLCPGETYTSPSGLYVWNTNGSYVDTIPNAGGCDSMVYIDLVYFSGVNLTVNTSPTGLESQDLNGAWQWIDCNNSNQPISGATSQMFYPTDDGTYAVILDNSYCVDTSDCIIFNFLSDEAESGEEVYIYPNPTRDYIFINAEHQPLSIELFDMSGRQLYVGQNAFSLDISYLVQGTYLLKINWIDSYSMYRVIRE